ncbi:ketopantoate reductase family protein [Alloalcanivorax gelatiniphagus]|uniref:2-dehydropantoate 2-reductase n=1 Tax=Alloalcanivorax gelatiniphagus TaxID=1194167 RepID=A0ABY2XHN5_9GAMM|nr:2-dehydropantoate 2-reductase [Alloalcanivorax gelatiniphagus]TMW10480.1 ketopantoate reductase family protein [Alloalcanivorax gelatiniphagus]|tara:strand:- start:7428 stop:8324 length:897 start_codon:yes stop_codon:yes gene_type:complete
MICSPDVPFWYLAGAGNMGTLAACYLRAAGFPVALPRRDGGPPAPLRKTLTFEDGRAPLALELPAAPAAPIRHLVVACKTPYSDAALADLPLAPDVTVLRLQNGLGSLDGRLPEGADLIEVVTTSAVKGRHPSHHLVAENQTWMGRARGGPAPAWFQTLARHWPGLEWAEPIRDRQWRKLVANAVINPLTGLYDVANGRLLEDPELSARARRLADEADTLLGALDPAWPGGSWDQVAAVAAATAGNTSSMRADMQRGAGTEIDAINGWLLREARRLGLELPAHREVVAAVRGRTLSAP